MSALELNISNKREELVEVLNFALAQPTVYLPVVRVLKLEIAVCDLALRKIRSRVSLARSG